MSFKDLCGAAYAVLFATADPMRPDKMAEILEIEEKAALEVLLTLQNNLDVEDSGVELLSLDGAFQLATKNKFGDVVKRALEIKKNTPLSQAALEVLAIVAYNQPVTRSFVEQVRGIDSSSVMSGLVEKGLIEESGRLDLPGQPLAYKTTENFLRCFSMSSLADLPPIEHEFVISEEEETAIGEEQ